MKCPQCGTENQPKFKFCVKCGNNLENPQEINIEQVDLGGYHTEEEYSSDSGGFKIGSGTFTISDNVPSDSSSDLYTADELNDSDDEYDFSSFDEPFIPKLDTGRVSLPQSAAEQPQPMSAQPNMYGYQQPMPGMPAAQPAPAPMGQQMTGMMQPQFVGYDQNGMPVYSQPQPMMYGQPQFVGYDQNGMPVYSQPQPMMYGQPQFVGYDQNGMPVYSQPQPMMYGQPQFIGYDQNGMPVYSQPQPMMYGQPMGEPVQNPYQMPYPNMNGMPQYGAVQPQPQPVPQQPEADDRVDVPDDFWAFFDGGKATKRAEQSDDFFGKNSGDMGSVSAEGLDMNRLKKFERKKVDYMSDTPLVDGSSLIPNTAAKFNKMYMRKTEVVNGEELGENVQEKVQDIMGVTDNVNADDLEAYERRKSGVSMKLADKADSEELEAYVHEHKEAIMAQADHAVEALPKKKTTYVDEIDAIVLPEYMQAKKTVTEEQPEIPGLTEF